MRLSVLDRPGVFAKIAAILAKAGIGISSIIQPEGHVGEAVPVILITYATTEDAVRKALAAVNRDKVISGKPQVIRIEKN